MVNSIVSYHIPQFFIHVTYVGLYRANNKRVLNQTYHEACGLRARLVLVEAVCGLRRIQCSIGKESISSAAQMGLTREKFQCVPINKPDT